MKTRLKTITENTVTVVKNKNELREILRVLDDNGFSWMSGDRLTGKRMLDVLDQNILYGSIRLFLFTDRTVGQSGLDSLVIGVKGFKEVPLDCIIGKKYYFKY